MASNIAINLKKLMKLANISESELSRRTNIKQPIIHRLLSGENTNPKLSTLKPIADYFMLNISQVIGENDLESSWGGFTSKKHNAWVQIPLINWEEAKSSGLKDISKFVISECKVSKEAFALHISDQSMEPVFPENSIVIIDPKISIDLPHGSYIAVKVNNKIILRNLLIISNVKYISPLNYKFGTLTKLENKDLILGAAVRTMFDHFNLSPKL